MYSHNSWKSYIMGLWNLVLDDGLQRVNRQLKTVWSWFLLSDAEATLSWKINFFDILWVELRDHHWLFYVERLQMQVEFQTTRQIFTDLTKDIVSAFRHFVVFLPIPENAKTKKSLEVTSTNQHDASKCVHWRFLPSRLLLLRLSSRWGGLLAG